MTHTLDGLLNFDRAKAKRTWRTICQRPDEPPVLQEMERHGGSDRRDKITLRKIRERYRVFVRRLDCVVVICISAIQRKKLETRAKQQSFLPICIPFSLALHRVGWQYWRFFFRFLVFEFIPLLSSPICPKYCARIEPCVAFRGKATNRRRVSRRISCSVSLRA